MFYKEAAGGLVSACKPSPWLFTLEVFHFFSSLLSLFLSLPSAVSFLMWSSNCGFLLLNLSETYDGAGYFKLGSSWGWEDDLSPSVFFFFFLATLAVSLQHLVASHSVETPDYRVELTRQSFHGDISMAVVTCYSNPPVEIFNIHYLLVQIKFVFQPSQNINMLSRALIWTSGCWGIFDSGLTLSKQMKGF